MAFMEQSFREAMEGTVAAAKTEIEAFVGTLAMRTGMDALRGGGAAPALLDGTVTGRDGSPAPADLAAWQGRLRLSPMRRLQGGLACPT